MNTVFENQWKLWYHSKKDIWTIDGYKKIYNIKTIKDFWKLFNNWDRIGTIHIKHFFIMKNNITPLWEDEMNQKGGCWSFKINDKDTFNLWLDLSVYLVTGNISKINDEIVGISVCLKKNNISVIKIWNSNFKNNSMNLLNSDIIKKWGPEIIYISHMPDL